METKNYLEKARKFSVKNEIVLEGLKVGQDIYFKGEKLPMKLKALGNRFGVCLRELHKRHDADLLHFEVKRGAYATFTEAYKKLKGDVVYSCLDFEERKKAPHNIIFNGYDFRKQKDIDSLLKDLESGRAELSKRHYSELHIDWIKTEI